MPFAEVIFEPGSKSVLSYTDQNELKNALMEHHRRAINGESGGPAGHPAERISKVLLYNHHPADFGVGGKIDISILSELVNGMASEGTLDGNQLIGAVYDEMSPLHSTDQGRHESIYKMVGQPMDLSFLTESGGA